MNLGIINIIDTDYHKLDILEYNKLKLNSFNKAARTDRKAILVDQLEVAQRNRSSRVYSRSSTIHDSFYSDPKHVTKNIIAKNKRKNWKEEETGWNPINSKIYFSRNLKNIRYKLYRITEYFPYYTCIKTS